MPSSRQLIASQILGTTAATVTFSAIPGTYKDLILKVSTRSDFAQVDGFFRMEFNGSGGTAYSNTYIYGTGSTAGSGRRSNAARIADLIGQVYANATASTFSNCETYIPSYTASQNKPVGHSGVPETNAATFDNGVGATAGLWRNTAAITSIVLLPASGSFVSGSSFYLYGLAS